MFQIINGSADKEDVVLDFSAVEVLSPSFADELLSQLNEKYGMDKVKIVNAKSAAVSETLEAIKLVKANAS